jgi:hypothetical protein
VAPGALLPLNRERGVMDVVDLRFDVYHCSFSSIVGFTT